MAWAWSGPVKAFCTERLSCREVHGEVCPGIATTSVSLPTLVRVKREAARLCKVKRGLRHVRIRQQALQADTSAPETQQGLISLKISTCHKVQFGEVVKVVGEGHQLGSWDTQAAPAMEWSDGDNWELQLELEPGAYDFKCIVARADGSIAAWEPGSNRRIDLTLGDETAVEVVCPWSNTDQTLIETLDDDESAVLDSTGNGQVYSSRPSAEASSAAPSSSHSDGLPESVAEAGETQGEKLAHADTAAPSAVLRGQGGGPEQPATASSATATLEAPAATPPGSKPPVTSSAAASSASPSQASSTPQQASHAASSPGSSSSRQASQQEASSSGGDSSSETASTRGRDSGREPRPQQQAQAGQPESASGQTSILARAAAAAGLLAVPMVVWSEFTLARTGCGLPPGPDGYLGAAEGISYLTTAGLAVWSALSFLSAGPGRPGTAYPPYSFTPPTTHYFPLAQSPAGEPRRSGFVQAVQGLSLGVVFSGLAVLGYQYRTYGYIPSATPDAHCFGEAKARASSGASLQSQLQEGLAGFLAAPPAKAAETRQDLSRKEKPIQERDLLQEMRDGAIDGLSAADLEAAGEQLRRLSSFIFHAIEGLRTSAVKGADAVQNVGQSIGGGPQPALQSLAVVPTLSLRHLAVLQQASFTAATTNAISTATHVNSTLGTTIQQLQQSVQEVESVVGEVEQVVEGDPSSYDSRANLLDLQHTVVTLENVLGQANVAADVDLKPLIGQLSAATAELKLHGQQEGLVKKLEHAIASLEGVQSLQKVKPALATAQSQAQTDPFAGP